MRGHLVDLNEFGRGRESWHTAYRLEDLDLRTAAELLQPTRGRQDAGLERPDGRVVRVYPGLEALTHLGQVLGEDAPPLVQLDAQVANLLGPLGDALLGIELYERVSI